MIGIDASNDDGEVVDDDMSVSDLSSLGEESGTLRSESLLSKLSLMYGHELAPLMLLNEHEHEHEQHELEHGRGHRREHGHGQGHEHEGAQGPGKLGAFGITIMSMSLAALISIVVFESTRPYEKTLSGDATLLSYRSKTSLFEHALSISACVLTTLSIAAMVKFAASAEALSGCADLVIKLLACNVLASVCAVGSSLRATFILREYPHEHYDYCNEDALYALPPFVNASSGKLESCMLGAYTSMASGDWERAHPCLSYTTDRESDDNIIVYDLITYDDDDVDTDSTQCMSITNLRIEGERWLPQELALDYSLGNFGFCASLCEGACNCVKQKDMVANATATAFDDWMYMNALDGDWSTVDKFPSRPRLQVYRECTAFETWEFGECSAPRMADTQGKSAIDMKTSRALLAVSSACFGALALSFGAHGMYCVRHGGRGACPGLTSHTSFPSTPTAFVGWRSRFKPGVRSYTPTGYIELPFANAGSPLAPAVVGGSGEAGGARGPDVNITHDQQHPH